MNVLHGCYLYCSLAWFAIGYCRLYGYRLRESIIITLVFMAVIYAILTIGQRTCPLLYRINPGITH